MASQALRRGFKDADQATRERFAERSKYDTPRPRTAHSEPARGPAWDTIQPTNSKAESNAPTTRSALELMSIRLIFFTFIIQGAARRTGMAIPARLAFF